MAVKLKDQLTNALGDEMRKVEMDVTSSFLNGKICSTLISYGINTLQSANSIKNNVLNVTSQAGIYITKDGLQVDPSVVVDVGKSIVNIALETAKDELLNIRNMAWQEISYIPDPGIIVRGALSYFSYQLQNNMDIDDILDDAPIEDKVEELEEKRKTGLPAKIQKFIDEKLPGINQRITNGTAYIQEYCTYASYYMAFGPDWISDKIEEGINSASYAISYELFNATYEFNNLKMDLYQKTAYFAGEQMYKQYEALLRSEIQDLHNDQETQKSKVKIEAQKLLQTANLKIMAKTGIKIPIDKISPENLEKVKRSAKLAKLLNMATGGSSNDTGNSGEKPADETTTVQNLKYDDSTCNHIASQLNVLIKYLKIELNNEGNTEEYKLELKKTIFTADYLASTINTLVNDPNYNVDRRNLDNKMDAALQLLNSSSFEDEDGNWINWEPDSMEFLKSGALNNVTVIGQGKKINVEEIPEEQINPLMMADTFINTPPTATV